MKSKDAIIIVLTIILVLGLCIMCCRSGNAYVEVTQHEQKKPAKSDAIKTMFWRWKRIAAGNH